VVADLQVGRIGFGHQAGGDVWGHLCWRVSRF
jgi:hypothetical protein